MGGVEEVGAGFVEHGTPAGGGGRDAEAEEAEGGFGENGSGHADGGLDDEGLEDVGQDVPGEEAKVGGAEGAGGFDEFALLDGHDLGADETGVTDPSGEREGEDEVAEAGADEGDEGDGEQDAGDGEEGVHGVDVEGDVGDAACVTGERADDEPEQEREGDDAESDGERDPGSEDAAGEDVATEFIGAEEMAGAGGKHAAAEVERGGVFAGEPGGEEGGDEEEGEQSIASEKCQRLLAQDRERLPARGLLDAVGRHTGMIREPGLG